MKPHAAAVAVLRGKGAKRKRAGGRVRQDVPLVVPGVYFTKHGYQLQLPVHIVSEANNTEHWTAKRKRGRAQQLIVERELKQWLPLPQPLVVKLVRIAPRKLDSDNLARAFKKVRDAIATWLGVDDGDDEAVTWLYAQEKPRHPGRYGIRVEFEEREATA